MKRDRLTARCHHSRPPRDGGGRVVLVTNDHQRPLPHTHLSHHHHHRATGGWINGHRHAPIGWLAVAGWHVRAVHAYCVRGACIQRALRTCACRGRRTDDAVTRSCPVGACLRVVTRLSVCHAHRMQRARGACLRVVTRPSATPTACSARVAHVCAS